MAGCLCILYQYDKLLIAFRNTQSNKYTLNNFVNVRLLLSHGTFCKHFSQQDKCDPLTNHFYIVKLGYKGVYIYFFVVLFLLKTYIGAATSENRSSGFPNRSGTNRAGKSQKMARGSKFQI